jgi:hypothetical protein
MSATEGHLHALMALSGNALYADARKALIQSLSGDQLHALNQEILESCMTRKLPEGLSIALLDFHMGNRRAAGGALPTPTVIPATSQKIHRN